MTSNHVTVRKGLDETEKRGLPPRTESIESQKEHEKQRQKSNNNNTTISKNTSDHVIVKSVAKDNNSVATVTDHHNDPEGNNAVNANSQTQSIAIEELDVLNDHVNQNEKTEISESSNSENVSNRLSSISSGQSVQAISNSQSQQRGKSKYQLFKSENDFRDVDLYAVEAPNGCKDSFESLAKYLTSPFNSELTKFRAIWRWVTANIEYDTETFFNQQSERLPEANNILRSGKGVCDGYASVVMELCRHAGIKIKKITGYAKGFNYRPGNKIKGTNTNHAWNAVKLQGQWWLCDFTWGAGYVGNDKRFVWNYTEHYFLTEPEEFILDHFPVENEWQLLDSYYTIEEFEKWAKFYKHFFIYQLKPLTHKNGIVIATNGMVEVALETRIPVNVSCKLSFSTGNSTSDLSEYCFHNQENNKAIFQARLPQTGDYELKIFSQKSSNDAVKSYDSVVYYMIQCDKALSNCQAFPKTFSSWTQGFVLLEPAYGSLPKNKTVCFSIKAPQTVTEMVVCVSGGEGDWLPLELKSEGIWKGECSFNSNAELVNVVMKLDQQTSTTYSGILKYTIEV